MIQFRKWGYTYPTRPQPVLSEVTLNIPAATITLVIGESGSGKSTLVRSLNGLVPHLSGGKITGQLYVNGRNPIDEGPARMAQTVGMVFQDPENQFVLDRVEDEVAFALENAAIPRSEMLLRLDRVFSELGITHLRHRQLSTLSGGEQQRVAIASALALLPQVLVLDEPTSQLDPLSAHDVLTSITSLQKSLSLTVVMVEHRLERVVDFIDQVILLQAATAILGTPSDILAQSPLAPPFVRLAKQLKLELSELTQSELRNRIRAHLTSSRTVHPRHSRKPHYTQSICVSLKGVQAGYTSQPVVHITDWQISSHCITALLGRNGAGKSTLLKAIMGLTPWRDGLIEIDGMRLDRLDTPEIGRLVGYLPQNPNALLFADTIRDELNITRLNHGLPILTEPESTAALERLCLAGLAQAYPRDLSSGQRERAAIGAVTITQPRLILLDEPTRGLDRLAKLQLAALMQEWKSHGSAIVLVTHDIEFVAECADRVAIMEGGTIVADGDPYDILTSRPEFTPQVAAAFPDSGCLTVEDVVDATA